MKHRFHNTSVVLTMALLLALTGCASITPLQSGVGRLDQGTHAAADAQSAFMTAYRVSECRSQNFDSIKAATEGKDAFALTPKCAPVLLTDDDVTIRNHLMASIVLYADNLQDLASGGRIKTLNDNSEKLAGDINSFGKTSGLKQLQVSDGIDAQAVAALETALISITEFVLEKKNNATVKESARAMQPHIEVIANTLKTENLITENNMHNNVRNVENKIKATLAKMVEKNDPGSLLAIVQGQELVASITATQLYGGNTQLPSDNPATTGICDLGSAAATTTQDDVTAGAPPSGPPQTGWAAPLNKMLDSIVAANKAIAEGNAASLMASVNILKTCGDATKAIYGDLSK